MESENQAAKEEAAKEEAAKRPQYTADLPWPPICVQEPNFVYGQAMLDNLGGSNSEMSAVSLYFYDHLICNFEEELSNAFHKISIVEMHHLEIFGALALQLGMDPRLWSRHGRRFLWWTPGYHKYDSCVTDLLINAIRSENAAIEKYASQAGKICDSNIRAILERIIQDEQIHVNILTGLYEKYRCK